MHEHLLLRDLISKIQSLGREQNAKKILNVTIRVGVLSHISPEHLREHFDRAVKGTIIEGADLVIDQTDDPNDIHAQDIMLDSVEISE